MVRRPALVLLLFCCGVHLPSVSRAQTPAGEAGVRVPAAREHFDRGAALAEARDYEGASREFAASYAADPRKDSLFAWAQVERLWGHCDRAIDLYRRFLDAEPSPQQAEVVRLNMHRCERQLEEANRTRPPDEVPPPLSPPPVASSPALASVPVAAAPPPPTKRDPARLLRGLLWGGAAVALVAAGSLFILARPDDSAAQRADTYDMYYPAARRAHTKQTAAVGCLMGGLVLGGAALVEWLWPLRSETGATAWIGSQGSAGAAWRGTF